MAVKRHVKYPEKVIAFTMQSEGTREKDEEFLTSGNNINFRSKYLQTLLFWILSE